MLQGWRTVSVCACRLWPTKRRGGREQLVTELLRRAGFPVDVSDDMAGWLATHAVFITAVGSAILAAGGDSTALAADRKQVADRCNAAVTAMSSPTA